MNTLAERAKILVEMAGSITSLAEIAGIRPPSISDWLNGKTKSIKGTPAAKIAKRFDLNPIWITDGIGPMKQPYKTTTSIASEANAEYGPAIGWMQNVPVVGMAQLGDNGFWAEINTPVGFGDGHIPFPAKSRHAYALRCTGESMRPRIKNGEFVIVDPEQSPCPGDEVLVKSKDGRVMVKELLYIRDDAVHLMSVNEEHGKVSIPLSEVECLHMVAGIMPHHTWAKG